MIPVKSTSWEVVRSSNFGGSLCIGSAPSRSSSAIPSILSPVTFMTRPRICAPTGIVIGADVFTTSIPLCSPSVLSIATVLTVSSPICCCTSTMSSRPFFLFITRASWMRGSALATSSPEMSKCTSTTGPITCEMCPVNPGISLSFFYFTYNHAASGLRTYQSGPVPAACSKSRAWDENPVPIHVIRKAYFLPVFSFFCHFFTFAPSA